MKTPKRNNPFTTHNNRPAKSTTESTAEKKKNSRKIILIGPSQCGKTSLLNRFMANTFTPLPNNTQRNNSYADDEQLLLEQSRVLPHTLEYTHRGHNLHLEVVDFRGNFHNLSVRDYYIKTSDVIIIAYECGNTDSLKDAMKLYSTIREVREDRMSITLVGTRLDQLPAHARQNLDQSAETKELLLRMPGVKHIMTSAKYNVNIEEAFQQGFDDIIRKLHTYFITDEEFNNLKRKTVNTFAKSDGSRIFKGIRFGCFGAC